MDEQRGRLMKKLRNSTTFTRTYELSILLEKYVNKSYSVSINDVFLDSLNYPRVHSYSVRCSVRVGFTNKSINFHHKRRTFDCHRVILFLHVHKCRWRLSSYRAVILGCYMQSQNLILQNTSSENKKNLRGKTYWGIFFHMILLIKPLIFN